MKWEAFNLKAGFQITMSKIITIFKFGDCDLKSEKGVLGYRILTDYFDCK